MQWDRWRQDTVDRKPAAGGASGNFIPPAGWNDLEGSVPGWGVKRPCHVRQRANAATRKSCFLHQTQCGRPISPQLPREPKTRGKYEGKSARTEVLMTRRRDISAAVLSNQKRRPSFYGTKEVPREEGLFCPVTTNHFLLLIRIIIELMKMFSEHLVCLRQIEEPGLRGNREEHKPLSIFTAECGTLQTLQHINYRRHDQLSVDHQWTSEQCSSDWWRRWCFHMRAARCPEASNCRIINVCAIDRPAAAPSFSGI